jgi:hypothetical protein
MKKLVLKQKWLLTVAMLFLWGTVTNIAAETGYPTGVTVTAATGEGVIEIKGTGESDAIVVTTTNLNSNGTVTFTATPTTSGIADYNEGNYEFRFALDALPTDAEYTPGTSSNSWLHTIVFTDDNEAEAVSLTISYVRKVTIATLPASDGTDGVASVTAAVGSAGAGNVGKFTFTATPTTITAENFAKYKYVWKYTIAATKASVAVEDPLPAGLTISPADGDLVTSATATPVTVNINYTEAFTTTVDALTITAAIKQEPFVTVNTTADQTTIARINNTTIASGALSTAEVVNTDGNDQFTFSVTLASTVATGGKWTLGPSGSPYTEVTSTSALATEKYLVTAGTGTTYNFTVKKTGSFTAPNALAALEVTYTEPVGTIAVTKGNTGTAISFNPTSGNATPGFDFITTATVTGVTGYNQNNYAWKFTYDAGTGDGPTDITDNETANQLTATAEAVNDELPSSTAYTITVGIPATATAGPINIVATHDELYKVTADTVKANGLYTEADAEDGTYEGSGIKVISPVTGDPTGEEAGSYTFKVTIKDEYATGGELTAYTFSTQANVTTEEEYDEDITLDEIEAGSDDRVYVVTIAGITGEAGDDGVTHLDLRFKYSGNLLAPPAAPYTVTKHTTNTDNSNPITEIKKISGETIVDGKIVFIVKPTVPRAIGSTAAIAVDGGAVTVATSAQYAGTTFLTTKTAAGLDVPAGTALTTGVSYYLSQPNEEGVDTFIISNITDKNVNIVVKYDAPDIIVKHKRGELADGTSLLEETNGVPTDKTLTDGTGIYQLNGTKGFEVTLTEAAWKAKDGGEFSFVFQLTTGTAPNAVTKVIDYPEIVSVEKKVLNPITGETSDDTYVVQVKGLLYSTTTIVVGYDTVPAIAVTPPEPDKPYTEITTSGEVTTALNAAEEGEIIAASKNALKATADLGATSEEIDQYTQKGTIVPGEKLKTTLTVTDQSVIKATTQTVVLTFTGPLNILPPLTVENVLITKTVFEIVYVFDSSTNTLRNARTRAAEDTWTEYDAVKHILYVHLVDIDVTVLGGNPSYAQLAIKTGEKIGPTIADADWAVTLYDNPVQLIPDNGVPGTNYPGYFTLDGNYPTDGQLRYKVGNDANWKPFYNTITNQEIERLAQGEYLYFGLAAGTLSSEDGVSDAIFIYVPKTYATTGDNPVVVPRPYAIVAATTNSTKLNFSRTAGTTTTGEFTFKVTPEEVIQNGTLFLTFTKNGADVNPQPTHDPIFPDIDGAFSVTIRNIKVSDIVITVEYRQGVGVAEVSTSKVWSYGNTLFISSTSNGTAKIYSLSGQLVKVVNVTTGVTITELPTGVYLVNTVDNKISKIVVN